MRAAGAMLLSLVAACQFHPGTETARDGHAGDGDRGDDAGGDGAGSDGTSGAFCNPADLDLRACYTFDGDTLDRSSYANNAVAANTSFTTGHAGQAIVTSGTSSVVVAGGTSLDVSALTIRIWIRPSSFPIDPARMGLVDSGGRYRMFLLANGLVRCAITGGPSAVTTASNAVALATWTHLVCTYDGATMRIYVDGAIAATLAQTATIPTGAGMVIGQNNPTGENFDGALDELEIWGSIVGP
jgi:hypothetical protein